MAKNADFSAPSPTPFSNPFLGFNGSFQFFQYPPAHFVGDPEAEGSQKMEGGSPFMRPVFFDKFSLEEEPESNEKSRIPPSLQKNRLGKLELFKQYGDLESLMSREDLDNPDTRIEILKGANPIGLQLKLDICMLREKTKYRSIPVEGLSPSQRKRYQEQTVGEEDIVSRYHLWEDPKDDKLYFLEFSLKTKNKWEDLISQLVHSTTINFYDDSFELLFAGLCYCASKLGKQVDVFRYGAERLFAGSLMRGLQKDSSDENYYSDEQRVRLFSELLLSKDPTRAKGWANPNSSLQFLTFYLSKTAQDKKALIEISLQALDVWTTYFKQGRRDLAYGFSPYISSIATLCDKTEGVSGRQAQALLDKSMSYLEMLVREHRTPEEILFVGDVMANFYFANFDKPIQRIRNIAGDYREEFRKIPSANGLII